MRRQPGAASDERRGPSIASRPHTTHRGRGHVRHIDPPATAFASGTGRFATIEPARDWSCHRSAIAVMAPPPPHRDGLREDDVAQIVHDLKNPLSTIALETFLLDEKLASGEQVDTRGVVARITHNIYYIDRMVQELLDSCALASGHFELHRQPTELRGLLEQIVDRAVSTRDRGRVVLDAPSPLTLSLDPLRIERAISNLLHNALKYAPRPARIVIRLDGSLDRCRVSVTDTGPGLTTAELGFVFDKHRRTTSAGTLEGSGIGLHVTKQIVEAHGGRIGVDSVPGTGSRFYFELPRG